MSDENSLQIPLGKTGSFTWPNGQTVDLINATGLPVVADRLSDERPTVRFHASLHAKEVSPELEQLRNENAELRARVTSLEILWNEANTMRANTLTLVHQYAARVDELEAEKRSDDTDTEVPEV